MDRFSGLDNRFDEVRRVPLRGDDVVAFRLQPCLEQLSLRGLARSVRTLERDQEPSAWRPAEAFAREAAQVSDLGGREQHSAEELTSGAVPRHEIFVADDDVRAIAA